MTTMTTATATASRDATAPVWQIDPAHTQTQFEVKHMMFAKVRGQFGELSGTVQFDPTDLAASRVDAVIQSTSIETGVADRDAHLRSGDFLDVERYPELQFTSRKVTAVAEGSFAVVGDLTIRDVTREVMLAVEETGRGLDPWGNNRVGFSASTSIDRRDFGLTWNQALETGGILVGTDVKITIEVQAIEPAA
jgi:polyisoprenoid-binding protein YceI